MRVDVLTLFPGMFRGFLDESMLKIAQEKKIVQIVVHDIRDYSTDRHRKVDDRPYGGGPGMVLRPEPVVGAIESVLEGRSVGRDARLVVLTPVGSRFDQETARRFAAGPDLILLCGHYEGFDQRICDAFPHEEISLGDFVLTGGEVPALAVIDATVRLIPGVLGDVDSAAQDSFTSGLLEHPHYTRPAVFRGMEVPEVLLSGDHARIRRWRESQSIDRTRSRRADLLAKTSDAAGSSVENPITTGLSQMETGRRRTSAGPDESNLERG
ncbi:MAG: tRNA (guanosine(37)-N1)-methyltransferase TrmD [Planctomycetes bacterium]|nr:tRNA (guanosine(37)-N1)-methyltransferase TrmD [Planctomycetota bacterium]